MLRRTEHTYVVYECIKDQQTEPREKWKREENAPGQGREGERKNRAGVGCKVGTLSFEEERKEWRIDADVRSSLVWKEGVS